MRARARIATRWRSNLAFALVVAVIASVVLALAAGAARTARAPDRFAATQLTDVDAAVLQESGRSRATEIGGLPSVERVASMTFLMAGLVSQDDGSFVDAIVFAGSPDASGGFLVAGTLPDSGNPREFVATRRFVEAAASAIGSTFQFVSLTQEQADRFGFDVSDPQGPTFEATLVGVIDGIAGGDPAQPLEPVAVFAPSILEGVDIGVKSSVMAVALDDGRTLTDFRSDLDSLPEPEQFGVSPVEIVNNSVRSAVRGQATGLWVLAIVTAVASVVALGQISSRRSRQSDRERSSLRSIGFTRRQIVGESVAVAAVPVVGGVMVGIGGAVSLSAVFPVGFVRLIEPDNGIRFDAALLIPGAVVLAIAIVAWTWIALALGRTGELPSVSPALERCAAASPTPAMATGLRFAYGRSTSGVASVVSALLGVMAASAGVVAAVSIGASIDHLLNDPPSQGRYFDAVFGDAGETEPSEELRRELDADAAVAGVSVLAAGQARRGDETVGLVGFERIRGAEVLEAEVGRVPTASDEIALGRLEARRLERRIGDELTLDGATGTATFRVTGIVVMPPIGGNDGAGDDGLVTLEGLRRLDEAAVGVAVGINLVPDAPPGSLERIAESLGLEGQDGADAPPEPVLNLERVRLLPDVIAVILALLASLMVGHTLFVSVAHRRSDMAVLGAIGADRRLITHVVHWQATTFTLVPVVVGVPIGLAIGRWVYRWLAIDLGLAGDVSTPYLLIVVVVVGLLVLANVAAAIPAHRARRYRLAQSLRAE